MIDIVFHGTPIGKSRPRFGRTKTGGVVTYTPQKTRDYERALKSFAQVAMIGKTVLEGPVKVTITAYFSHKTKTGWHVSRPDLDNIIKAVLDALNEIVFDDDAAVCEIVASKKYDNEERVEVQVVNV
jgi:Holliday junction resolvase RusA-like endonuclease